MLSGNHFKKKMDKKAKKKEAKKNAAMNTKNSSHKSGGNGDSKRRDGGAPQHSGSSGASSFHGNQHHGAQSGSTTSSSFSFSSPLKSKPQKSTLKGPVVDYGNGEKGDRDVANDRRGVPFRNKQEAKAYQMQQNRGKKGMKGKTSLSSSAPSNATSTSASTGLRSSLASSQAQRRRVLRRKGGEDLLTHFKTQLTASTFRLLNEELYNSSTAYGAQLLREEGTFRDYHTGYRQQLAQWPVNPNHIVVGSLLRHKRGLFTSSLASLCSSSAPGGGGGEHSKGKTEKREEEGDGDMEGEKKDNKPSKHGIPRHWVIADMGCGEAQIAEALRPLGYTVHSFDLFAVNDRVTIADTSKVPLSDASVDVCIFSLSLMAIDYEKSVLEAIRILKPKGLLKIIEVRSRIPSPQKFGECIASMGCVLEGQEVIGDYFVAFDFTKEDSGRARPPASFAHPPGSVLLPSMYKKR